MSEPRHLRDKLQAIRTRELLNRGLEEVRALLVIALAAALGTASWNALAPSGWAVDWIWIALPLAAVAVYRAGRWWPAESLEVVAARVDRDAGLDDELVSAWWFLRHPRPSAWIDHHLDRAADTIDRLDPERLAPIRRPQRLHVPLLLGLGLIAVLILPVPRAGELLAERLSDFALAAPEAREPVAELREAVPEPREVRPEPEETRPEIELPTTEEEGETQGEDALPEEGTPAPGDEAQEAEPGPEDRQDAEEGGEQRPAEAGEQGEPGEQVPAEGSEEMPGSEGQQPPPDASASQQQGAGEPAEQEGTMLPGGDEVFLQEGGDDLQRGAEADEEMGHATRTGGGEEELEAGEAPTPLEVQLQREILALPQEAASPEETEEAEQKVTRAEQSLLELQPVDPQGEFGRQRVLSGEPIPWRYRSLVLDYFRALRQRDNQARDEDS